MVGRTFGIIAGHILSRKGVHLSADAVERVGNFKRSTFLRTLELHVFDEMGNAVFRVRLRGRTRFDENPHRNGQKSFHLLDHQAKPVFISFFVNHLLSSRL